ncbi:MAG: flagellar basal-body rod protein FlgB [Gammaproteobacteria bacterium 39-13]|nr:flagellar basal body rod protein FlgB [Gammaproteobacteria bacterium]OJV88441.1 MAG: flagellar basal-body rod protein FlgB [Gammaproteobacteria bacterium 39-13]
MNLNNIFGIHEQAVELRAKRAEVLASNLANADTPRYKARDLDFKEVLSELTGQVPALTTTNPSHIGPSQEVSEPDLKYRVALQMGLDANTVDTQVETGKFAQNSIQYSASLRFIDMKIRNMLTAIRGE